MASGAENYYPTDEDPAMEESDMKDAPSTEEKDKDQTALLPKSILGGKTFEPGEEVVLKIVHVYEDEVEVAYATEEKKKSAMDEADDSLMNMASQSEDY